MRDCDVKAESLRARLKKLQIVLEHLISTDEGVTPEEKLVELFKEMSGMHEELGCLGKRKISLARKAFDLQVVYTGLVEKKIRFMERDGGIGSEDIKLRASTNPTAVEDHIFSADRWEEEVELLEPGWDH